MLHAIPHRQTMLLLPVFLAGIWIGQLRLPDGDGENYQPVRLAKPPAPPSSETLNQCHDESPQPIAGCAVNSLSPSKPEPGRARHRRKAGDAIATHGSHSAEPARAAVRLDQSDGNSPLWAQPVRTADGDIVVSLEAAGVAKEQVQPATIMGLIIQADGPEY